MSTPIVIEYDDAKHKYAITTPPIGPVPSVTQVLGILDKPGLKYGAAKVTVNSVAKLHRRYCGKSDFNDEDAIRTLLRDENLTFDKVWGKTATRGTNIHLIAQLWVEEGRIPSPGDFPTSQHGYVRGYGAWVMAHAPEFICSEVRVASVNYRYAGTYDARLKLGKRCETPRCACQSINPGAVVRIDYKTSPKVYAFENFSQLDLYEVAAHEMGEPYADARAVLQLGRDGSYDFAKSPLPIGVALPFVESAHAKKKAETVCKKWERERAA